MKYILSIKGFDGLSGNRCQRSRVLALFALRKIGTTKKADRSLPLWVTNPYQTHMIMF